MFQKILNKHSYPTEVSQCRTQSSEFSSCHLSQKSCNYHQEQRVGRSLNPGLRFCSPVLNPPLIYMARDASVYRGSGPTEGKLSEKLWGCPNPRWGNTFQWCSCFGVIHPLEVNPHSCSRIKSSKFPGSQSWTLVGPYCVFLVVSARQEQIFAYISLGKEISQHERISSLSQTSGKYKYQWQATAFSTRSPGNCIK